MRAIFVKLPSVCGRNDREELSRCLLIKRNRDLLYCSSSKAGSSIEVSTDGRRDDKVSRVHSVNIIKEVFGLFGREPRSTNVYYHHSQNLSRK